jgi:hypothetical protein
MSLADKLRIAASSVMAGVNAGASINRGNDEQAEDESMTQHRATLGRPAS